jgi:hypothetical protein
VSAPLRRLEVGGKADATALRRRWVHELADRRENGGDRLVVTLELALELDELAGQLGVGGTELAQ